LSKQNKKTKPKKEAQPVHVCGEFNGVMGKGSFTKKGDKFACVECGKELGTLPEVWVKANPEGAKLLLKGQKNSGPKDPKMVEAGKKAWATRRKKQEAKLQATKLSCRSSQKKTA